MNIQIFHGPEWFYGNDLYIDLVSVIVMFSLFFFTYRAYKIDEEKKSFKYMSIAMLMIALGFIFKIIGNFMIYNGALTLTLVNAKGMLYRVLDINNYSFIVLFFLYELITLFGLLILYNIYQEKQSRSDIVLFSFFILVMAYLSRYIYHAFHVTALLLLLMIAYHYWNHYRIERIKNQLFLAISFTTIAFSQVMFIFTKYDALYYVIAEAVQLLGYALLLLTFLLVLSHGKQLRKKKK